MNEKRVNYCYMEHKESVKGQKKKEVITFLVDTRKYLVLTRQYLVSTKKYFVSMRKFLGSSTKYLVHISLAVCVCE